MSDKAKKKNHSPKNLKINTRIILTNTIAGVLVLILIAIISMSVRGTLPSFLNVSRVDTQSYSMLNQLQWSQAMSSLSNGLRDDDTKRGKLLIDNTIEGLENVGSLVYVECDGEEYYSSSSKAEVVAKAKDITSFSFSDNLNSFGEKGVVIVAHTSNQDKHYTILIANSNYTVDDYTGSFSNQELFSVFFSRTGIIIAIMVLVFVLAIVAISFVSSKTISKPISKLAKGAEELSKGNFDYVIDYESKNEIGQTVDSFNYMVSQMRRSIDERDSIEQSRKEMIAGVAHDLRTPLTSVKGYVEGLRDGIASTPEKQQRYLQTIYSSTLDMERLLDELLTTSRLELGQINLNKEDIDLNCFMRDCADEIKPILDECDFDFSYVNANEDEEIMVSLDTDNFARVIKNIVSNSIKYADKSRRGRLELEVQSYAKSVIVSLADNGIGVSGENLGKIFDTFFRADQARTRVREGSGVGLAVCKQIVEMHGGHIWATSKQGEGLTILISLEKIMVDNDE